MSQQRCTAANVARVMQPCRKRNEWNKIAAPHHFCAPSNYSAKALFQLRLIFEYKLPKVERTFIEELRAAIRESIFGEMNVRTPSLLLIALSFALPIDPTIAQQSYSFEDACRMAGRTTGACASAPQQQALPACVSLTGNAFHADKSSDTDCIQTTLSPVTDAEIFVEMIGLANISRINDLKLTIGRSVDFMNAVALFHNGSRMIIVDPDWARSASAESYLVLGHEAGHHFCGHVVEGDPLARKRQELEADQFSGASIKRFEAYHDRAFLRAALQAASTLYSASESASHPSRQARLEAILHGYNTGSSCATLAPGIRGYTAGPR